MAASRSNKDYRRHHYVPVWYQKRFIPDDARDVELYYRDLSPGTFTDPRGVKHDREPVRKLGPKHCFYKNDLYTAQIRGITDKSIEQQFFGQIDRDGHKAVEHFSGFHHMKEGTHEMFQPFLDYLSTQKLRTPKGLDWLAHHAKTSDQEQLLGYLVKYRALFCAIWSESVWLFADASKSDTKFIVTDTPVTIYNRICGPRSDWCKGYNDPDVRMNGSHTIFPLSKDEILIMTNLSWARNPRLDPKAFRPNPNLWREALLTLLDIQIGRHLSEQEVREINFILMSRARKYIAAGKEEWLYPDEYVSKSDWTNYGNGYLLMPDPRSMSFRGEIIMTSRDGRATAFDEYGRRPWDRDFRKRQVGGGRDFRIFQQFKGEFARLFGPYRRGRAYSMGIDLDPEMDSEDTHKMRLRGEHLAHHPRRKSSRKRPKRKK